MRSILEKVLTVMMAMSFITHPSPVYAHHTGGARPQSSDPASFISQLGPVLFSQGGGALLPLSVLSGVRNGRIPPMMQFVLMNHMMNSCVKDVIKHHPQRRDPYVRAKAVFDEGLCRIKKCYQQAMVMGLLSGASDNPGNGGSANPARRQANQQQALLMLTAFQKDEGCSGGNEDGGGFDPMMLMLLQQQGPQAQLR